MSLAAKQAANAVPRKLQDALDALDNFEALHRLDDNQAALWGLARSSMLQAMGAMVALEIAGTEEVQ